MTWRTHAVIGANTIWLAGIFGTGVAGQSLGQSLLILLPVAVVASLLPDIDATSAKIHYVAGGILGIFKGAFYGKYFHHRGIMHSFFVSFLVFLILWLIFRDSQPLLPYVAGLSYLSHPIIDGLNTKVGYLYPFIRTRFALAPKFLLSRVGGPIDFFLMFAGALGLILFFALFAKELIPLASNSAGY